MSQFNLSSIPAGSTVASAKLYLHVITRETTNRGLNLNLHDLTQAWQEDGVTWGYRDLNANQTWSGGGSIGSTLASVGFPASAGWMEFDVPVTTVQGWVDTPAQNFGLLIKSSDEAHSELSPKEDFLRIASSEHADVSLRPKLEVTFTPSGNIGPHACLTIDPEAVITPGHHLRITADAHDADGTIDRVDFYANSQLVESDSSAPYTCSWASSGKGNQALHVVAHDNSGGTGTSATLTIQAGTLLYSADMNSNPGWQLEPEWEYGTPSGVDGSTIDGYGEPASGYTGTNVIGYQLDSPYYVGTSTPKYATTPAIDCTGHENITLTFRAWLGAWFTSYGDRANLLVSSDGSNWTTIWANQYSHCGGSWPLWSFDISSVADGQPTVYVRWENQGGQYRTQYAYSGWNLDDVRLTGEQTQAVDSDGDRMPDLWEEANGLNPTINDANADADGDGQSNYSEFAAHTDPGNATSRLAVASIGKLESGVALNWHSTSGSYYSVYSSTNLAATNWTVRLDNIPATAPLNVLNVPVNATKFECFRIGLE